MTASLTDLIARAVAQWPCTYETETGALFVGGRLDDLKKQAVEVGYRNVSRIDARDVRAAGFRVVRARYSNGVRPPRFAAEVVVYRELTAEETAAFRAARGR